MTPAEFRQIRKSLGLTQLELAERLGVKELTIIRKEKSGPILNRDVLAMQALQATLTPVKGVTVRQNARGNVVGIVDAKAEKAKAALATTVRRALAAGKVTQADLARALGVDKAIVSRFVNGASMSAANLVKAAKLVKGRG